MKKLFIFIATILLVGCEAKKPDQTCNKSCCSDVGKMKSLIPEEDYSTTVIRIGSNFYSIDDLLIIVEEELKKNDEEELNQQEENEISKVY